MAIRDDLGNRMKSYYEAVPKTKLMRRTPVALRIDGKAFHTFTRGFKKPFDDIMCETMTDTMKYLCENIQGCVFGYTQSDEITLILVDYQNLDTDAYFDYEVQKLCSVTASMATMKFNKVFSDLVNDYTYKESYSFACDDNIGYRTKLLQAKVKGAVFDCRCFNIPKEEVTNLVYWRQLDAARNSVESLGRHYYSAKQLYKKSCKDIKQMLIDDSKPLTYDMLDTKFQIGSACKKGSNGKWVVDTNMPLLKGEDRQYLDSLIFI